MARKKNAFIFCFIGIPLIYNFVNVLMNVDTNRVDSDVRELYGNGLFTLQRQNKTDIKQKKAKYVHYITTRPSKIHDRKMGFQYERRLPKVLGIGVKKCGTTALLRFLDLHPDIVLPTKPELHFFDTDDYFKGTEYYRSLMPYTTIHELAIEKTPRYFVLRDTPLRVRRMNPSMKLLLVVCDPIKRAYSDYHFESNRPTKHYLKVKKDAMMPASFDKFVSSVLQQMKTSQRVSRQPYKHVEETILNSWSITAYYLSILNSGVYSVYLKHWLKYFPLEQILIVNGEELLTNPVKVLKEAQQFLGVEVKVDEKDIVYDETKGYYCIRKYREENVLQCLGEAKGTTRNKNISDVMASSTLKSLKSFYFKYNNELFDIIGKKYDWT